MEVQQAGVASCLRHIFESTVLEPAEAFNLSNRIAEDLSKIARHWLELGDFAAAENCYELVARVYSEAGAKVPDREMATRISTNAGYWLLRAEDVRTEVLSLRQRRMHRRIFVVKFVPSRKLEVPRVAPHRAILAAKRTTGVYQSAVVLSPRLWSIDNLDLEGFRSSSRPRPSLGDIERAVRDLLSEKVVDGDGYPSLDIEIEISHRGATRESEWHGMRPFEVYSGILLERAPTVGKEHVGEYNLELRGLRTQVLGTRRSTYLERDMELLI